jgi:neurabin
MNRRCSSNFTSSCLDIFPSYFQLLNAHFDCFISGGKSSKTDENHDMNQRDQQNVTKRKKVSSICFNVPAAGLGTRPVSEISSVSDDGGFNEPSPEIKAPLKPAYPYDTFILSPSKIPMVHHDDQAPKTNGGEPTVKTATLNYVDIEHRVRPDGTESAKIYDEADAYKSANNSSSITSKFAKSSSLDVEIGRDPSRHLIANRSQTIDEASEKVLYAQIRPELPPAAELIFDETKKDEAKILDFDDMTDKQKGYHSPQSMLDPTR